MNVNELRDDSDSSDEDYVPTEKLEDLPSEIDEDDPISDSEERCRNSRAKGKGSKNKRQRQNNKKETNKTVDIAPPLETANKTNNVDDLWADFVKDTGFKSKNNQNSNNKEPDSSKAKQSKSITPTESTELSKKLTDKVKVTQIFEFAGEEVKIEKEVRADSAEARLLNRQEPSNSNSNKIKRSAGLSGIGNVLSQLNKKQKISTLEKTKLDWDCFKRDNSIEEELETFNKGKDGYLERQDFLQRTDVRRFEIEKGIREVERNKRFNSS